MLLVNGIHNIDIYMHFLLYVIRMKLSISASYITFLDDICVLSDYFSVIASDLFLYELQHLYPQLHGGREPHKVPLD